ncbi:ATP-dependent DNA helicase PIF1-like [Arachis duranensis]|uniref:ATP-dependent DNA helicase n=1 Tax=Arachis duranensis TaxID=130453 RepID=A0A6P4AW87_ARADU|nr:ATP-dependent DNA helicase PIF1-like [Arachis duranensis]
MGGLFFLYGQGGCGKIFLWSTISYSIRFKGGIVLNIASSGIAALLLPNGRTAHLRFKIPLAINEDSLCNIKQRSPLARLISKAKLIIWDEAPMISKYCFETLDKCLRDILRCSDSYNAHLPFGGKVAVLGEDFRQILLVIPRGSKQDIIQSFINSSYLWHNCKVLKLTKNMRLLLGENNNIQELKNFGEWLLKIGDGLAGDTTDGKSIVHIPSDILIKNSETALDDLINFVYPDMLSNLSVENYFKDRAILVPTLDCVTDVNNKMTAGLPGQERVYLSSDFVCAEEGNMEFELDAFSPEILNGINCSGLPPHKLVLKIGAPFMLLRNINQTNSLCNGTRMQVRRMGNHVIECKTLTGNKAGSIVLIPRLNLIPNNETLPVRFQRRQFPIIMSFAMTINKSQGQTLSKVGIYLPMPVFTYGQLYVALSRVTSKDSLRVLL